MELDSESPDSQARALSAAATVLRVEAGLNPAPPEWKMLPHLTKASGPVLLTVFLEPQTPGSSLWVQPKLSTSHHERVKHFPQA